jgi:hypothetical protein
MRKEYSQIGGQLSDNEYCSIILKSIPRSYRQFISTLIAVWEERKTSPNDQPPYNSDKIILHLTKEYHTRSAESSINSSIKNTNIALNARKKSSNVECWNCGKKGHVKSECHAEEVKQEVDQSNGSNSGNRGRGGKRGRGCGRGGRGQGNNSNQSANTAINDNSPPGYDYAVTAVPKAFISCLADQHDTIKTIYDSGASTHVSPYCELFQNFHESKDTLIGVGKSSINGVGDIEIQAPVPNGTAKLLLHDVVYAPDAPAMLVSTPKFEKAGCEIRQFDGHLSITSPSNVLLASIPRSANVDLYMTSEPRNRRSQSAFHTSKNVPVRTD